MNKLSKNSQQENNCNINEGFLSEGNPFHTDSPNDLTDFIMSFIPSSGIWESRAYSFMLSLMNVLTHLRDRGEIDLHTETIRAYFKIEKIEELIAREDIENHYKSGLILFLESLPGYDKHRKKEPHTLGFITMYYTEAFMFIDEALNRNNQKVIL